MMGLATMSIRRRGKSGRIRKETKMITRGTIVIQLVCIGSCESVLKLFFKNVEENAHTEDKIRELALFCCFSNRTNFCHMCC